MIPPELRITDAEVALARRWPTCRDCCGHSFHDGTDCARCCGWGLDDEGYGVRLGYHASARIGAALVAKLPHLRHATWPAKGERPSGLAEVVHVAVGGSLRPTAIETRSSGDYTRRGVP